MQSRIHSWPRLINDYKDIPSCFQRHCLSEIYNGISFPYTVYLPSYSWNERETNETLLCLCNEELYILEELKYGTQVTRYYLEDIIFLNRGSMLLYSWIKIVGLSNNEIKTTLIEFNTVTENLFEKLLVMVRSKYSGCEKQAAVDSICACSDQSELNALSAIDYKFMNYARKSILPDTVIYDLLFQSAIKLKYLKYFSRTLSKAHLHILSGNELIAIKEDYTEISRFKSRKYLAVWSYIPLNRIRNICIEKHQADMPIELKIEISSEVCLSSYFDNSKEKRLSELIKLTKSKI